MLNVDVISPGRQLSDHMAGHIQKALRSAHQAVAEGGSGDQEVSVLLTGADGISALHETYFGDPSPTDVISFPASDQEGGGEYLGDIAICLSVAAEQAAEAGNSEVREVVFLALHGLLHLLGWSDDDAEQRRSMLELQENLLRQYENAEGRL